MINLSTWHVNDSIDLFIQGTWTCFVLSYLCVLVTIPIWMQGLFLTYTFSLWKFVHQLYLHLNSTFFLFVCFIWNFETHQRLRPLHWLWPIRRSILMICSVGKSLQTFLFGSLCYVFAKWWIDWSSFFALLNVIEALVIGCSDLLRWIGSF